MILFAVICVLFMVVSHIDMERRFERREILLPRMGVGQFSADLVVAKKNID